MRVGMVRVLMIALGSICFSLAACTSQDPRFFMLTGFPAQVQNSPVLKHNLAVGVGPVEFPDYLDRTQIVTRTGSNELEIAEFDRWAEPLSHNFTQVLAENMAVLLSSNRIVTYPWRRAIAVDYQLVVKVTRFDCLEGSECRLNARWSILGADGKSVMWTRDSVYSEKISGRDYGDTVRMMNQALAGFSREAAEAIRNVAK